MVTALRASIGGTRSAGPMTLRDRAVRLAAVEGDIRRASPVRLAGGATGEVGLREVGGLRLGRAVADDLHAGGPLEVVPVRGGELRSLRDHLGELQPSGVADQVEVEEPPIGP